MSKDRRRDEELGAAGTEGGRRPPGVPAAGAAAGGPLAPGQRWTVARKREAALRVLRGEPLALLSRELGVEICRLEERRDAALAGIDEALKCRNVDPLKAEYDVPMKRVGELSMENELVWQRVRRPSPLAERRSKK